MSEVEEGREVKGWCSKAGFLSHSRGRCSASGPPIRTRGLNVISSSFSVSRDSASVISTQTFVR